MRAAVTSSATPIRWLSLHPNPGASFPCEGGPYSLPDGRAAIKALTWEELKDIVIYFELLNPYNPRLVRDCFLKVEGVNFDDDVPMQLFGWAIAAKRYALFRRTLRRTPVAAVWPPHYIGKETNRRWQHAEDISIVESEGTEYTPNETARLIADPDLPSELANFSNRTLHKASGAALHTIKAAKRRKRVRRTTVEKLRKALAKLKDDTESAGSISALP
jgi:hypothetical protein